MRSGRDNTLTIIDDQVLSGNDVAEIAGNGSLYLLEVGEVQYTVILIYQTYSVCF